MQLEEEFWSNFEEILDVMDVCDLFSGYRFYAIITSWFYPILMDFFQQSSFFWLLNIAEFIPAFIMYSLIFITVLSYYIHYPKRVINSQSPDIFDPNDTDLPYNLLVNSFIFVLFFSPFLSYILFSSFPMVYISLMVIVWVRTYAILSLRNTTFYAKLFISTYCGTSTLFSIFLLLLLY